MLANVYLLSTSAFIFFRSDETFENVESKIRGKSFSSERSSRNFLHVVLSQLCTERVRGQAERYKSHFHIWLFDKQQNNI